MSPVDFSIHKPVTVIVGVILISLFGFIAATTLPVQLTPNVDKPLVGVRTRWEGASPQEVEREIIDEQEDKLKGIPGLAKMTSRAVEGEATIELEFQLGTDISRALLEVSDKLRQVPDYPENVDEPVVAAGETQGVNAIAWFIVKPREGSEVDPLTIPLRRTLVEERVKPILERARGVSSIGVVGGREREVQISIDPVRLAARGLALSDVRDAIRRRNKDVSAGRADVGKLAITVRTVGRFDDLDDIRNLVLARRQGRLVRLGDVARVRFGHKKATTIVRSFGRPAIALNAQRQSGTNVLLVMDSLREAVQEANRAILNPLGLELEQVYDQTTYIYSAIDLVQQNLWVGGLLAVAVLLLFLRSARSTLVVAVAIPVSVIGSFLALNLLGRNLNVVSLAGLAFAIGMVVDNSIVVLENIYRHRLEGKKPFQAALDGTREVFGAVLASTLTTLAVFLPIVFIEEEAGQLFRDIAIAISSAVALSLLVSVFFIPMAAARLVRGRSAGEKPSGARHPLLDVLCLGPPARAFTAGVSSLVGWINRGLVRQILVLLVLIGGAIHFSVALLPPMSYLPQGNQNLVIGFLIPPPGYNTEEFVRMGKEVERVLEPYFADSDSGPLPRDLAHPAWYEGEAPIPRIRNFFFVAFGQTVFMGAASVDPTNVRPLQDLFARATADLPGVYSFAMQSSLFERGVTAGNTIEVEVTGSDMPSVTAAAGMLFGRIMGRLGPPRPEPANFSLGAPEMRVEVDEVKAAELGLSVSGLGFDVQCMIDGAIVSDFRDQGQSIDVKIVPQRRAEESLAELADLPIHAPIGSRVPLGSVATITRTTSPSEILHIEERRAVKLIVTPPREMELSTTMEVLQQEIIAPLRAEGSLPPGVSVHLAGTADKLVSTRRALSGGFLLAVVITYLLLAALFESFLYPLVIMVSVPLAAVGGVMGLRIVHGVTGQQMDVLTMLGFVILVGTVVNNAILIVHHALGLIRNQAVSPREAVIRSVRTRVRPIFMSTATSVLGMTPLVLFPGAGSELYRGLGSVVVGGLVASTLFTLLAVPTLFSLLIQARGRLGRLLR